MKAAYNKVPEVKTEAVYRAVSVPSYNLVPVVEVAGDTAIDTPGAAGAGEDPGSGTGRRRRLTRRRWGPGR